MWLQSISYTHIYAIFYHCVPNVFLMFNHIPSSHEDGTMLVWSHMYKFSYANSMQSCVNVTAGEHQLFLFYFIYIFFNLDYYLYDSIYYKNISYRSFKSSIIATILMRRFKYVLEFFHTCEKTFCTMQTMIWNVLPAIISYSKYISSTIYNFGQ